MMSFTREPADGPSADRPPSALTRHDPAPINGVAVLVATGSDVTSASGEWLRLAGEQVRAEPGQHWLDVVHPDDRPAVRRSLRRAAAGLDAACDVRLIGLDGATTTSVRCGVHHPAGWPPGANIIVLVGAGAEGSRAALPASTSLDPLTGLLDRAAFLRLLDQRLGDGDDRSQLAVLFIDLDHFKDINDQHGHGVGDRVLMATGIRIAGTRRHGDHLARLGGDEMAVLSTAVGSTGDATRLAERIVAVVAEPLQVGELTIRLGASVGVAIERSDGSCANGLIQRADQAMYRAKAEGRSRWVLFGDGPSPASGDRERATWAAVDQASHAVLRAERHIRELQQSSRPLGDQALTRTLRDVAQTLQVAQQHLQHDGVADAARASDWPTGRGAGEGAEP